MTEELELEALQYLLGEMDAGSRARFEARLARDPVLQGTVKSCAEAMTRFACDTAPAEPMSARDQQATLAAILAQTAPAAEQPARRWADVVPWSRYIWPAAAAVLLGLNLVQLSRQYPPANVPASAPHSAEPGVAVAPESNEAGANESAPASTAVVNATPDETGGTTPSVVERSPAVAPSGVSAEQARRLEELRNDYAELERTNAQLRAQYDAMVQHVAGRVAIDGRAGRIAAMELVDAATYAKGERKGLMDIARSILVEPGVVVIDTAGRPDDDGSTNGEVGVTIGPGTGTPPATAQPYAWSVFDDQEHRGYLNLYNLPQLPTDKALHVWVKSVDSSGFQRVGEVPNQFYGSNGSVYYTLPAGTTAPVEILITQEARNATPAVPGELVVLRGP